MPEVKLISPSMEQVRGLRDDFPPEFDLDLERGVEKLLHAKTFAELCALPAWPPRAAHDLQSRARERANKN